MLLLGAHDARAAGAGGATASPTATVSAIRCVAHCSGGAVYPGGTVRLSGSGLSAARAVTFLGRSGASDDTAAPARHPDDAHVDVTVPARTAGGPVRLKLFDGRTGAASRPRVLIAGDFDTSAPVTRSSAVDAQVTNRRVFFYARAQAQVTYKLKGSRPQDVRVRLVRLSDGASVASWTARSVAPGGGHRVRWRGVSGHSSARAGRYDFRIAVGAAARTRGRSAARSELSAGRFAFFDGLFPVRGRHDYGGAGARFGAGRSGHRHQGQDVLAACGTRLVAARGGIVRYKASQSAAGNYVVIDGAGTSLDTVYMHLREPALVSKGQRVYTGQTLGYVGRTGDASACHLHFEVWSGGWYTGSGHPIDPLGLLRAWDRVS